MFSHIYLKTCICYVYHIYIFLYNNIKKKGILIILLKITIFVIYISFYKITVGQMKYCINLNV